MDILSALKSEASKLQKRLDSLNSAIKALGGENNTGRGGKRYFSAASRAKMARAQRARWARTKAAKKKSA